LRHTVPSPPESTGGDARPLARLGPGRDSLDEKDLKIRRFDEPSLCRARRPSRRVQTGAAQSAGSLIPVGLGVREAGVRAAAWRGGPIRMG